ncbi:hypothetical protein F2P81_025674 [Scophthalmus maximus]|uniref:Uncharacterized protein n=2 Tax=Scophthalmus maximus TaxID=52904 RepID=A0A6A4RJM8_SCOMX|nr:hypothetical protein F2P81_025674 [Scophthalmus maximus]
MQEGDMEDRNLQGFSHTLGEYLDSIKELSQPAPYPRHGPLRGHRRWTVRSCSGATPMAPSVSFTSFMTYAPWIPVDISDVSLSFTDQSHDDVSPRLNCNLLDRLAAESLFAGLV